VSVPTRTDSLSSAERLESISARVAQLRAETLALADRVSDVSQHAREMRNLPRVGCSHAEQVQRMQTSLTALEHEIAGLRTAMQTRGVIEQAKGMLMLQRRCDADEAFDVLVHLSQTSHRKLVQVAEALVASWAARDGAS
jgi:hypothetical protein